MKKLIKYFMFGAGLLLFSTLTGCDTAESSLKRAIKNGEYELTERNNVALRLIEERKADRYYILLEDVKATDIKAKKGDPEIFGYTFLKMKFQDPETGKIYETYSYYTYLGFSPDVEKAKKGQKIRAVLEKDSKGKWIVLASGLKL